MINLRKVQNKKTAVKITFTAVYCLFLSDINH